MQVPRVESFRRWRDGSRVEVHRMADGARILGSKFHSIIVEWNLKFFRSVLRRFYGSYLCLFHESTLCCKMFKVFTCSRPLFWCFAVAVVTVPDPSGSF